MIILKHILMALVTFATIYPLTFWVTSKYPLKYPFHKYHLRITNFASGIAVLTLLFMPISASSKGFLIIWKISLFGMSIFYWKRPKVNYWAMTLPFVLGLFALSKLMREFMISGPPLFFISVLSGFLFCSIFFIIHVCVWNSIHDEKSHALLKKFLEVYSLLLLLRLGWGGFVILITNVCPYPSYMESFACMLIRQGDSVPFIGVLSVAFLPFIATTYFRGKLENNSYSWAVGFMFPVLLVTILGEICLKVVWHKYGIPL